MKKIIFVCVWTFWKRGSEGKILHIQRLLGIQISMPNNDFVLSLSSLFLEYTQAYSEGHYICWSCSFGSN